MKWTSLSWNFLFSLLERHTCIPYDALYKRRWEWAPVCSGSEENLRYQMLGLLLSAVYARLICCVICQAGWFRSCILYLLKDAPWRPRGENGNCSCKYLSNRKIAIERTKLFSSVWESFFCNLPKYQCRTCAPRSPRLLWQVPAEE